MREWYEAGAFAVGVGSQLCAPELIAAGRFDEITRRAAMHVQAAWRRGAGTHA
jgi:2-keto-3-deoxy-6-phosphogluconate aldolase